jgi:hypothetical protein
MPQTSLLGLPIKGEYKKYNEGFPSPQRPLEEFSPYLQKLLDDPEVTQFGWVQYTPYFNDGDACIFHAYGAWVKTVSDSPDHEWEFEVGSDDPQQHRDFSDAVEGGHFYIALLETFGDPARITVDKDTGEIRMDYYEHD